MTRIFEIGLGKTGTRSLATAAHMLGLRAIHGLGTREKDADHQHRKILQDDFMRKASRGRCDFQVCEEYEYIGHIGAPFFRALDSQYPGSKFILTVRHLAPWIASFDTEVVTEWTQAYVDKFDAGEINYVIFWRLLLYGSVMYTPRSLSAATSRHYGAVINYFSHRSDLLIFPVGSGWPRLCEFLGRPIPDEPYPWIKKGRADVPLKGE